MKLHKMKTRKTKSYITIKQRITAAFMVVVLLLQICVPTIALAATAWGSQAEFNRQIQLQLESGLFSPVENASADEAYKGAFYLYQDAQPTKNLLNFYREYNGVSDSPVIKQVGDTFVQTRLIRSQIKALLGRFLIQETIAPLTVYAAEAEKINQLYANGLAYGGTGAGKIPLGTPLAEGIFVTTDMIWPEVRTINNKTVLIPVVYLSQTTLDKKVADHNINFFGDTEFAGITIDKNVLLNGYNNTITGINGIINSGGKIQSTGDLTLSSSGTIANLGGVFSATENLKIVAEDFYNKTLVVSYKDKNGEGTRIGSVASISGGNIEIHANNDITFEGATATSGGKISLNAGNDINVLPITTQNNGQSQSGHWEINKSTTELLMSRLAAEDTLSLIAGGVINITASELISTSGGIELLAGEGIHILDELEQTSIQKEDRKGKTKGTSSEFRTETVRAILNAGKGVLLDSEHGDVVLRATQLTSTSGTEVYARNGKVHLLMTKELEEFHLQTTRKGSWTIKTRTEDIIHENNIQNAIVGGLQVQAMYGINVEYTGKDGATLKEQIEEYRKMPEMKWMAELYDKAVAEGGQNVNWEVIEEVHKELRKSKSSLSPAAMAIIAIAVCVAMGPAGAGLLGSGTGAIGAATFNGAVMVNAAVMQAGALTLATQAAQSLSSGNNLRETISAFDSNENLKSLAISMATAGAMQYADIDMFTVAAESKNLAVSLSGQAAQAVVNSTVSAGISVAINGGNTKDFETAFVQGLAMSAVNKLGKEMAEKIGNAFDSPESLDLAFKYISHAASGCIIGAAKAKINDSPDAQDSCYVGAGGAVIGEVIASQYRSNEDIQNAKKAVEDFIKENGDEVARLRAEGYTNEQIMDHFNGVDEFYETVKRLEYLKQAGVDLAKLGAAFGAFVAGAEAQQIDIAASAGANAAENNALSTFAIMNVIGMAIDSLEVDLTGALGPTEQLMIAGADGLVELALAYQELQDGLAGESLVADPFYGDPLSEPAVMGGVIAGVLDTANVLGIGADAFLRLSADYHAGNLDLSSSATMDRLKGLVQEIGNAANIVINIDDFSAKVQGALITASTGDRRAQAEVARFTTSMTISVLAGGLGSGVGAARAVTAIDKSIVRLYELGEEGKLDADALFKQEGFKVEAVSQNEFKVISIPSQIPKLPNPWTDAKFNHVWEGDYSDGYKKLSGGMHTQSGLDEFKSVNAGVGRVFDEKVVADFSGGINSTNTILKQELPNGVIRVHLPNEGINKTTRQSAVVTNNQGEVVRGIKTLFPSSWTKADIKNAGQAVINQQGGIIKEGQISGVYKGVKIEVRLDKASGIINTVHPSWEQ